MRRSKLLLSSSLQHNSRPSAGTRGKSLLGPALLMLFALSGAAQTSASHPAADPSPCTGWFVISVDDYQSLRTRAFPGEREPEPPPVDATLTRVDYDLRI